MSLTFTKQQAELMRSLLDSGQLNEGTRKQLQEQFPELFPDDVVSNSDTWAKARSWAAKKGYKSVRPPAGEILIYEQGSAEAYELVQVFSKLLFIAELWNGDGAVTGMLYTVNYNVKDNRLYVGQWSDRHVTPIYFRTYDLAEKSMEMHATLWRQFYRR